MHPVFNLVAPDGYLLPTVYLFMADIANQDLFVCGCGICICLHIARFYKKKIAKNGNWGGVTIAGAAGLDTICTAVYNRCDRSTTCRMCRLEPLCWSQQLH